jgi:DNA-binding transcriptional MerR regulator
MILRGKRVHLSLAEIREILDLYDKNDGGVAQSARMLKKFRERIATLEVQREDLDSAIGELKAACERLEETLKQSHPDLLGQAEAYDKVVRARVDGRHPEPVR